MIWRFEFRCLKFRDNVHNRLKTGMATNMPLKLLGILVIRH